ncbi:poly(A) polymerase I [Pseudohongiella nitratireducens]|uniref:Poly(A) polymerase I n=1 Tax=Pseudohongiella nitratireducens TaxID=1768907 RepID=A0A916QLV9_9GAMM|nr:polynucleotide adenylyltransferase PcnB [Pseudohongiella nitratireducens]GFZ78415.1 poly(A) polymerase I [Pseudohongiella nitratireducens]
MLKRIAKLFLGKSTVSAPAKNAEKPAETDYTPRPAKQGQRQQRKSTAKKPQDGNSPADGFTLSPQDLASITPADVSIVKRDAHNISRRDISPAALKVLYRLGDAGYQAFLVGGGVRDLLLGGHPKDFDISTDATPEQVKSVFRNARIIGRRFKIVHVRFGREIIEVTTFRAHHDTEPLTEDQDRKSIKHLDSAHAASGMILRDNVYGKIDEDAIRRDFSVNAIYYTTKGFALLDFVDGLADIEARQIRMIGDPAVRYREDPVRLLRAVRLASKLGFEIESATKAPIKELAPLLASISSARLFDETVKLFTTGKAQQTFSMLREYDLADYLFKPALEALDQAKPVHARILEKAMSNTDLRLSQGKSITPAFMYAALLWPALHQQLAQLHNNSGRPPMPILQQAASQAIVEQLKFTAIPKRLTAMMREIWELQWRLAPRSAKQVESVYSHPKFRAAYDFLVLREEAGEDTAQAGQWWTAFQACDNAGQRAMMEQLVPPAGKKKNKRRRRKKPQETGKA